MSHDLIERQLIHQIYVVAGGGKRQDALGASGRHIELAGNRRMVCAVGVEQQLTEWSQSGAIIGSMVNRDSLLK